MKKTISLIFIITISLLLISDCEKKLYDKYNFQVEYLNKAGDFNFKDEYLKDIADKSYQLLEYIKNKDLNSIVEMCYDGEIMYDSMNERYISKKNLYKDFSNNGYVYSLFFDSEKYYKSNQKYIDHHVAVYAKEDYKLCLRDVLLKYDILINTLQLSRIEKSVIVYLDWKGKKSSQSGRIGYTIGFVYLNNKWKIRVLLDRNTF